MSTFSWTPDFGAAKRQAPRVQSVRFGDGYEQRARLGLNTNLAKWDLRFSNRDTTEADAIDAFLAALGGADAFAWTPPGGTAANWVCREWTRTLDRANLYTITAAFEQVADP